MLLLSPGVPTGSEGRDLGLLHETKDSTRRDGPPGALEPAGLSADEAADAVTDAFASFRGARPRPVHVEIPIDVLEQDWSGTARRGDRGGRTGTGPGRRRPRGGAARPRARAR